MGSGASIQEVRSLTVEELAGAATASAPAAAASGQASSVAKIIRDNEINGTTAVELDNETVISLTENQLHQKQCLGALHFAQQCVLGEQREEQREPEAQCVLDEQKEEKREPEALTDEATQLLQIKVSERDDLKNAALEIRARLELQQAKTLSLSSEAEALLDPISHSLEKCVDLLRRHHGLVRVNELTAIQSPDPAMVTVARAVIILLNLAGQVLPEPSPAPPSEGGTADGHHADAAEVTVTDFAGSTVAAIRVAATATVDVVRQQLGCAVGDKLLLPDAEQALGGATTIGSLAAPPDGAGDAAVRLVLLRHSRDDEEDWRTFQNWIRKDANLDKFTRGLGVDELHPAIVANATEAAARMPGDSELELAASLEQAAPPRGRRLPALLASLALAVRMKLALEAVRPELMRGTEKLRAENQELNKTIGELQSAAMARCKRQMASWRS